MVLSIVLTLQVFVYYAMKYKVETLEVHCSLVRSSYHSNSIVLIVLRIMRKYTSHHLHITKHVQT